MIYIQFEINQLTFAINQYLIFSTEVTFFQKLAARNPSLAYKELRLYLLVRFFVIFALNMQSTTLFYWIYDLSGSKLKLGLIGLAEVIPAVTFSLISGYFVDKNEKRKMLMICIGAYIITAIALYFLTTKSTVAGIDNNYLLWYIYGLVFIGGVIRAFMGPSSFALMGFLVPKKLYPNATSWSSMTWQLGAVLGPLTAGVIIAQWTIEGSMMLVCFFLFISFLSLWFISKKPIVPQKKEPILSNLTEGLKFVFRTPVLLGALALDLFSVLFGGAIALLPVFQKEILMVDETGYGILRAAPGIGAIITMIIITILPLRTNPGKKLFICVAGFGLSIIVFGLSKNFYLSMAALIFSGLFDAVSVLIRGTILQLVTPEYMRGRVAAVNTMFISSSNELGDFESGIMAHWLGPVKAVVVGGCLTLAVVMATIYKAPQLRKFRYEDYE